MPPMVSLQFNSTIIHSVWIWDLSSTILFCTPKIATLYSALVHSVYFRISTIIRFIKQYWNCLLHTLRSLAFLPIAIITLFEMIFVQRISLWTPQPHHFIGNGPRLRSDQSHGQKSVWGFWIRNGSDWHSTAVHINHLLPIIYLIVFLIVMQNPNPSFPRTWSMNFHSTFLFLSLQRKGLWNGRINLNEICPNWNYKSFRNLISQNLNWSNSRKSRYKRRKKDKTGDAPPFHNCEFFYIVLRVFFPSSSLSVCPVLYSLENLLILTTLVLPLSLCCSIP